ncbi:MAG: SDR family oxidoreductase [Gemmatimonadota bacterium]
MDLELKGRAAIVTGGSKGIGRAIALGLAAEGANVAVCARGAEALAAVERELRERGVKSFALPCDVADAELLDHFLEEAHRLLGRVDILVNNASALAFGDDEAAWLASLQTDVMGAVRATRKVTPWMVEQGGGSIVHISSGSGLEAGSPPAYAAAKAALISYSKTTAIALAPNKIRVNVIAPGSIEFPGGVWEQIYTTMRPTYDSVLATIPSGRMGTDTEVANAAVFLASARASWITGVCLGVDGGQRKANI